VRQQFREFRARLAVPCELEFRPEQRGVWIDERGAVALKQLGGRQSPIVFGECGLIIEELQVARGPGHEEVDDALGLRCEVRHTRRERFTHKGLHRLRLPLTEQGCERDGTESHAAVAEKPTAGESALVVEEEVFLRRHGFTPS
jgi:hypothetical protein